MKRLTVLVSDGDYGVLERAAKERLPEGKRDDILALESMVEELAENAIAESCLRALGRPMSGSFTKRPAV